ncbi:MAG TPA: site-specific integrase [Bacteroidales bacterium]|nr:site-specific integrase [Bacteroidales bacterium]
MAKIQKNLLVNKIYQSVYFSLILDPRDRTERLEVAVRVATNGKKIYLRSGSNYTQSEFEKIMKGTKGELFEKKTNEMNFFNKVFNIATKLIDDDSFSFENLRNKVYGKNDESFENLFTEKIQNLKNEKKYKTAILYECSYNKLKEFYKKDILYSTISPEFVVKFSDFMKSDLSSTTIGIYLRHLRHICNIALSKGLIKQSQYPFSSRSFDVTKVKIPKSTKRKNRFLNIETITRLYQFYFEFDPQNTTEKLMKHSLGMWLFSYLANGMNLVDIANLKWDKHYFKTKGQEISFVRQKTKDSTSDEIIIYIPVTDFLKPLLDDLGTKPEKGKLIFPYIFGNETNEQKRVDKIGFENKNIAKRMARVCQLIGIDEAPSMTYARHSYQTNLAHQKVPGTYIDQQVGHTDRSVTDSYIGLYSPADRFTYNSLLLKL